MGHWCEAAFPPNAAPGQVYEVEPMGYRVAPMDMFSIGVFMFVLHAQTHPHRVALVTDPLWKYIQDHGLEALLLSWKTPLLCNDAMLLLADLLQANPADRCTLHGALANPWFQPCGASPALWASSPAPAMPESGSDVAGASSAPVPAAATASTGSGNPGSSASAADDAF